MKTSSLHNARHHYMSRADFDGITCNSQQHPQTADCRRQPTNIRQPATTAVAAEVEEGLLGTAGDVARTRDAVGDGVHIREADVVAVEAIRLVDLCEARVVGLDECDVDALRTMLAKEDGQIPAGIGNSPSTAQHRAPPAQQPGLWRYRQP